ncbi:hypothetical protein Salat_2077400 [Sesamum alatum]|uniref:Uncharacterized protein n=1 Tax=Sesamum alatum TaxID=300844 RepID=A0AAE1Y097_9LAMI|nr:hypothetical protein Salat_2077400 [Sesamum alatum]
MQARIANRLRTKKGTLPPNVVPLTDSSLQGASSAHRGRSSGHLGDFSAPLEPTPAISPVAPASGVPPIEIPSEDTEVAREEAKSKGKEAAEGPSEPKKRKRKHRGSRSSRSSKRRQDSWVMYKACLLPHDQVTLISIAHTRIEEHHAHVLTQAMAFGHHLSLRCSYFRKEKLTSDEKFSEAQKQLEESNKLRTAAEERAKQLEAQLEDLTLRSRIEVDTARTVALEVKKNEGFSAGCLAGKTKGLKESREVYLTSEEHRGYIKQTRLQGARDFLKAPAFNVAVEIKATEFLDQGFKRCKSQVLKLKGFTEGFDLNWLDPTLDGNLAAFPEEEAPPLVDDEFESLIEVEKMDAPPYT